MSCVNARTKKWRDENPGAFKQWHRENAEHRSQYWKAYYEENRDRISEGYAKWARENKHVVNALIAKRSAAKRKAMPSWANQDAIRKIYEECARRTAETGIPHEVDHIYPIQGEWVCGLHCEANLQILPKVENIRKKNRMPEDFGYA